MLGKILLCIDGEKHTDKAIDYALYIAKLTKAEFYVLHVIDEWLLSRNISHEIFASGRDEYRSYVKAELSRQSDEIVSKFLGKAEEQGIDATVKIRKGTPLKEILAETDSGDYDMIILGGKQYGGKLERLKSYRTPEKILEKSSSPVLVIKG